MHKCLHSHSAKVFPANLRTEQISSQRSSYVCSACCLPQGVKNSDQFPAEVVEAYKCMFSRPGALTGPINYYRAMFSHRQLASREVDNFCPNTHHMGT